MHTWVHRFEDKNLTIEEPICAPVRLLRPVPLLGPVHLLGPVRLFFLDEIPAYTLICPCTVIRFHEFFQPIRLLVPVRLLSSLEYALLFFS